MFRFCFIYSPLFFFSLIPNPILYRAIPSLGTHLLGVTAAITGGSDTVYDYLRVLCCVAVVAMGTAVILCLSVMANVFMLNMSYAVPLKILSSHLLLLSLFLIAPDARRLADVFVLNRGAARATIRGVVTAVDPPDRVGGAGPVDDRRIGPDARGQPPGLQGLQ